MTVFLFVAPILALGTAIAFGFWARNQILKMEKSNKPL